MSASTPSKATAKADSGNCPKSIKLWALKSFSALITR